MTKTSVLADIPAAFAAVPLRSLDESIPGIRERISNGQGGLRRNGSNIGLSQAEF